LQDYKSGLSARLQNLVIRIARAAEAAGRNAAEVRLLAVSKTWPADSVREAAAAGQRAFGENYVQEGVEKVRHLREAGVVGLQWHCIGPLQSNKTRPVAEHFDWVHTVDRLKVAQRLSEQRPEALGPLQVCVQVNIDGGANKSGVAPDAALALALAVSTLPRLQLRGLMTIPEPAADAGAARAVFDRVRALFDALGAQLRPQGVRWDTLSMGMSDDLEAAVAGGSTMVRVGTAIFGARLAPKAAA